MRAQLRRDEFVLTERKKQLEEAIEDCEDQLETVATIRRRARLTYRRKESDDPLGPVETLRVKRYIQRVPKIEWRQSFVPVYRELDPTVPVDWTERARGRPRQRAALHAAAVLRRVARRRVEGRRRTARRRRPARPFLNAGLPRQVLCAARQWLHWFCRYACSVPTRWPLLQLSPSRTRWSRETSRNPFVVQKQSWFHGHNR